MRHGALPSNVVAEIGIAMAVDRLLRSGFSVAIPIVDEGYDLLASEGRTTWRIQVKATGLREGGGRRVRAYRGHWHDTAYCPSLVDAFVALHVTDHLALCIPTRAVTGRWIYFRKYRSYTDFGVLRSIKPHK